MYREEREKNLLESAGFEPSLFAWNDFLCQKSNVIAKQLQDQILNLSDTISANFINKDYQWQQKCNF